MAPDDDDADGDAPVPTSEPPEAPCAPAPRGSGLDGPGGRWHAFNALYVKYLPFVRRILSRRGDLAPESAKDLAQTVFVALSHEMDKPEPIRNLEALLVTITKHQVSDHADRWKLPLAGEDETSEVLSEGPDPEQIAALDEHRARLQAHLEAMKRDQATVIVCIDLLEMTFAEVAELEARAPSTVYKRYQRARAVLDERIRAAGERAAPSAPGRGTGGEQD